MEGNTLPHLIKKSSKYPRAKKKMKAEVFTFDVVGMIEEHRSGLEIYIYNDERIYSMKALIGYKLKGINYMPLISIT